ncbi:glucokinase [Chryseobacterium koreense]|uniref:glucokinase n=1 Tax=Chryseobacterium koreense TaxID=232216 RepID=UPI0026F1C62A|nr:glucokinase [Chryseobacterium koreense]
MKNTHRFKLYLPGISAENNVDCSIISADLRQDKTLVGLYKAESGKVVLKQESEYGTSVFGSFSDLVHKFISDHHIKEVCRISAAVPGPVMGGKSAPQRLPWKLDAEDIKTATNAYKVSLINDMEASAFGLGNVREQDVDTIYESGNYIPGNVAILAPGAGLGEAGLFWDGESLRPFATEGGHCEFSPRTADEVEFYQFLNKIYGIVSWESVLSTSGLFNVYRFIRDIKRQKQPDWLTAEIEAGNFTQAIINGAREKKDRICTMTIDTFMNFLAREANSLVLKLKATGGLILTGELPNLMEEFLNRKQFYKNFIVSDKMESVLKDIPIYLVKNDKSILNGAALYAAFSEE